MAPSTTRLPSDHETEPIRLPGPQRILSIEQYVEQVRQALLDEREKYRGRLAFALLVERELNGARVRLQGFIESAEEKVDALKLALIEMGVSPEEVEGRLRHRRHESDGKQFRRSCEPYRDLHDNVLQKLLTERPDGMSIEDMITFVQRTDSLPNNWIVNEYPEDINQLICTDPSEVAGLSAALEEKICARFNDNPDEPIPEGFDESVFKDQVRQSIVDIRTTCGGHRHNLLPLPPMTLYGLLGRVPSAQEMLRVFDGEGNKRGYEFLGDLEGLDPEHGSIQVTVGAQLVDRYGLEALITEIRPHVDAGARIVSVHFRTDDNVSNLLKHMQGGNTLLGKARQGGTGVEVHATDTEAVEVCGLPEDVTSEEFLARPMFYLAHEFDVVNETPDGGGSASEDRTTPFAGNEEEEEAA